MGLAADSKRLLAWYDRHRRELPWRTAKADPYCTLVSEFMLQQTRVETVLPYYEKFLRRFPDVQSLAEAQETEVAVHWSGLGYYRRARQLHSAARAIHQLGRFPQTVEDWIELPGIGEYTASAVASIAFGVPVAVLDGNVIRVQSRRLGLSRVEGREARVSLRAAAQALLDPARPGDSNQAMMELGATVYTPRTPRCPGCPLRRGCRAAELGRPEEFPAPRRRRPSERRRLVAALVRDAAGRALLFRRPADQTLLAGTWELPWTEGEGRGACERELAVRYGGRWSLGESLGEVRHTITHRALRVELRAATCEAEDAVRESLEARWVGESELAGLARSSLVDKLLRRAAPR
jgi:A/G-specific adenine glycosylase